MQAPSPKRRLLVTADDFGIGYETSRGIVDAHLAGAVTATSVMTVTGDHLQCSLPLLSNAPHLELGLHLTLTSRAGSPLVATHASGLLDRDGFFRGINAQLAASHLRKFDRMALREEVLAQAERFNRLLGFPPAYLDGHHHAHQLPQVREVIAELVASGQLPKRVRSTIEPPETRPVRIDLMRRLIIGTLGRKARPVFQRAGATLTDGFVGILTSEMLRTPHPWEPYLKLLPVVGTFEMMTHPGHPDESLIGRDTYLDERKKELEALLKLGEKIHLP